MILFNKLIRNDLILLVVILLLFFVQGSFWRGFLEGMAGAVFVISIYSHIDHYKRTKKLY